MNEEMISVSVELAGRPYKVNVRESERQIFESSSEMVNEMIKGYEAKYAYKDKQDLLAMVLLQYVTALIRQNRKQNEDNKIVTERLETILQNLDKII
ncbi:MAG: cell division protein ZapA [Bacteroidales bacterium]|jgi:cell division protein ZapA|nr:cell division protein ZapA [Bacteroidales bacterium]MEE1097795.1 cell division protein ZapA [Bacteroidales bacterium]